MEKKRKRASFSPTITIEPDIYKEDREDKKPAVSQVVEVVVEKKGAKKSELPKINIVIPDARETQEVEVLPDEPEESVRLVEKKLPVSRQVVEEVDDEELEEEEAEIVKPRIKSQVTEIRAKHNTEEKEEVNEDEDALESEEEDEVEEKEVDDQKQDEDEEEVEEVEEVEVVADATQAKPQTKSEAKKEQEEQKNTVAELFGSKPTAPMPEITIHKSTNNKSLIIWAITMVAIAIGVGGGLVLFTNYNIDTPAVNAKITPTLAPKTTSTPQATPTPTKPAVSKEDVKVQVQNGGGKVGAGSKMKAFLEKAGYTVADVGNASSYTYDETEIVVKASVADLLPTLEKDLGDEYTLGTSKTTLPETSTYDVRVIVGKN